MKENIVKAYNIIKNRFIPILEYGHLKNGLILITNQEVSVELPCNIEDAHDILIHIPTLERCLKLGFKEIRYEKGRLIDKVEGISLDHTDASLEDFPEVKTELGIDVATTTLHYKRLQMVSKAIATERSRFAINGVALYKNGTVCCTDGRRMHIWGKTARLTKSADAILPQEIIKLSKLLKIEDSETVIYKDNAVVEGKWGVIRMRLISGKYPDIKAVISKEKSLYKVENVEKLLKILKKIRKVWKDPDEVGVKFTDKISWKGVNFPFDLPGEMNHLFSHWYLIEAIEAVQPERLEFKENHAPIQIQNGDKIAIVTPITVY